MSLEKFNNLLNKNSNRREFLKAAAIGAAVTAISVYNHSHFDSSTNKIEINTTSGTNITNSLPEHPVKIEEKKPDISNFIIAFDDTFDSYKNGKEGPSFVLTDGQIYEGDVPLTYEGNYLGLTRSIDIDENGAKRKNRSVSMKGVSENIFKENGLTQFRLKNILTIYNFHEGQKPIKQTISLKQIQDIYVITDPGYPEDINNNDLNVLCNALLYAKKEVNKMIVGKRSEKENEL